MQVNLAQLVLVVKVVDNNQYLEKPAPLIRRALQPDDRLLCNWPYDRQIARVPVNVNSLNFGQSFHHLINVFLLPLSKLKQNV